MDEINKIKKEYNKAEKTINELSLEFNRGPVEELTKVTNLEYNQLV